jgi:hypothetical protein
MRYNGANPQFCYQRCVAQSDQTISSTHTIFPRSFLSGCVWLTAIEKTKAESQLGASLTSLSTLSRPSVRLETFGFELALQ